MRTLTLSMVSTLVMVGHAHAGMQTNGIQTNGIQTNGIQTNGIQTNGIQTNGIQTNGIQTNGIQTNGIQTNGVQFSGVSITGTELSYVGLGSSVYPYSCAHREDVTGAALNNCSPCSRIVADADPWCRNNYWDGLCVSAAKSQCTLGAGTVLTASLSNGTSARMRIDSVTRGAASAWNGSVYTNMSDVRYNQVSWVLDHAPNVQGSPLPGGLNACTNAVVNVGGNGYQPDPYCANTYWDGLCVQAANALCGTTASSTAGASVCGTTADGTTPVQAIFLAGVWDQRWGQNGNGSKTASSTSFTIACRGIGAYAKCVDMGYKPWVSQSMDSHHQSCVRMVRADYCGDGNSFTVNGTPIDVLDSYSTTSNTSAADLQFYASSASPYGMNFEGTWSPSGAVILERYRQSGYQPSAYDGTPVMDYVRSRVAQGYCITERLWSGPDHHLPNGVHAFVANMVQF